MEDPATRPYPAPLCCGRLWMALGGLAFPLAFRSPRPSPRSSERACPLPACFLFSSCQTKLFSLYFFSEAHLDSIMQHSILWEHSALGHTIHSHCAGAAPALAGSTQPARG